MEVVVDIDSMYYTEEYVQKFFRCSTLAALRVRRSRDKNHPPFRKFGRLVKYPKKEFHAWVSAQPLRGEAASVG